MDQEEDKKGRQGDGEGRGEEDRSGHGRGQDQGPGPQGPAGQGPEKIPLEQVVQQGGVHLHPRIDPAHGRGLEV